MFQSTGIFVLMQLLVDLCNRRYLDFIHMANITVLTAKVILNESVKVKSQDVSYIILYGIFNTCTAGNL